MQSEILKRLTNSEGGEGVVGGQVKRPRQPDAVKAERGDTVGDGVDGLLAEAFGNYGVEMSHPVDASELDALAVLVDDPPRGGGERQSSGCDQKRRE